MSRARDLANLGDQAGSGFDASDLTSGTLGNTVQDNITRLGTVTTGTFNGTIGTSATGFGLITMADQWRLNTNGGDTGTSPAPITANWERADDASSGIIGTGMPNPASGVFTFPETGIYQVLCSFLLQSRNGDNQQAKAIIKVSTNSGSNFDEVAIGQTEIDSNDVAQVSIMALVDVTDENTFRVRFDLEASNSGSDVRALGSSGYNRSTVSFIRLGDT